MALNVTVVKFRKGNTTALASPLFQYDYGQIIKIEGLDLPDAYEVHFDNVLDGVEAIPQIGTADGVVIPDVLLEESDPIYAWVFLHEGEDDGETKYVITIPIKERSKATQVTPDPVEQDVITQTLAALNTAVNKANIAIKHYPYIGETGTWLVWDVETEAYVDTEIDATGPHGEQGIQGEAGETGNGIESVILNQDYTLTINYTNGDTYTTSSIRGEKGATGDAGNGIQDIRMNADYTLTITMEDGSVYTTTSIRGEKGEKGADGATGNGIDRITLNQDYTLTVYFTDGTSTTTSSIRGQKGEKGEKGSTGDTGNGIDHTVLNDDYTLTIYYTDGTSFTTTPIRGAQGKQGIQGETGEKGKDGSKIEFNNGVMIITGGDA